MKIVLCALTLVLFVAGICMAQETCKVEGSVKEVSGPAIGGVMITVKSSLGTGTGRTEKDGKYSLSVMCNEQSKHTVTPTKSGYVFDPPSRPYDKYSGAVNFTGRKQSK